MQSAGAFDDTSYRLRPRLWQVHYPALRANRAVLGLAAARLANTRGPLRVLDVGCGLRPFQALFPTAEYVGTDVTFDRARPRVLADNAYLPIRAESCDLVIASETLEHTPDYARAVGEMLRVLKPGGYLFISVPFLFPLHHVPHDYQRLTEFRLRALLDGCEIVALRASNKLFSTWLTVLSYALSFAAAPVPVVRRASPLVTLLLNSAAVAVDGLTDALADGSQAIPRVHAALNARMHNPRGLEGVLESMPCGYAVLARKVPLSRPDPGAPASADAQALGGRPQAPGG